MTLRKVGPKSPVSLSGNTLRTTRLRQCLHSTLSYEIAELDLEELREQRYGATASGSTTILYKESLSASGLDSEHPIR